MIRQALAADYAGLRTIATAGRHAIYDPCAVLCEIETNFGATEMQVDISFRGFFGDRLNQGFAPARTCLSERVALLRSRQRQRLT
jgi:hypothetical protein